MNDPSVLVIEDELPVREAVEASLRREGYTLLYAENGQEGLDLMRDEPPAVIILDLRMPVMDGFDFLRQIDLKPSDPYSVIVLTGHGNEEAIKKCYEAGVTFFLDKPFNSHQLRGLVKNAMTVRQLTNQLHQLVAEGTDELEQRITEITALNRYYQEQSRELLGQLTLYRRALEDREKLLQQIGCLSRSSEPFSFPDLPDSPGSGLNGCGTPMGR